MTQEAIAGLRMRIRSGQVWLHFTASDGSEASINLAAVAKDRGPETARSLLQWCEDRKGDWAKADAWA